jgi:hypothetical protein
MTKSKTSKRTLHHHFLIVIWNTVIFGLILVVVEGLASYMLTVHDIMATYPAAERLHTKYDSVLGWVNEKNVDIKDMYGPGIYLRTNSQGFRNNHDFEPAVPDGKHRIVCSGDSFTLGYGVDNDHTWCQLLATFDPRLETLNMGQGGYGVDQMYLWYKRDGAKFEHQVYLLAFITEDFNRMQSDTFLQYGKPLIDIENGKLVVKNVPVPRPAYDHSWLTDNVLPNLGRLRTVELLKRVGRRLRFAPNTAADKETIERTADEGIERTQKVLVKIFEDLKHLNAERSSKLVLVYLPTSYTTSYEDEVSEEWIKFTEKESQDLGIPLINVVSTFRSLPRSQTQSMFIPKGQLNYLDAAGHLNDQGNKFVAEVIYQGLKNVPAISPMLSPHR